MKLSKTARRRRIHKRIRKHIRGTAERPRLSVFRSNKAIYAQLIDDQTGSTIVSSSSKDVEIEDAKGKLDIAKAVGNQLAEKAKAHQISKVVFDRSGYLYHGRVKALADGARENGLIF